jgi:hypothetical protein
MTLFGNPGVYAGILLNSILPISNSWDPTVLVRVLNKGENRRRKRKK